MAALADVGLDVPAVRGLKFSMAHKNVQKVQVGGSASRGKGHSGEVSLGRSASWGSASLFSFVNGINLTFLSLPQLHTASG